jgi:hypothetical protein
VPLDTYAGLKTAIAAWAIRTGDAQFEAQVPDFITLAEKRFNRTLRVGGMEKTATLTPDGTGAIALPADYLEYRSVSSGVYGYDALEMVEPDFEVGRYEGGGVGQRFSISGNVLQTYPSASGGITITYFAKVPALSDAAPTNWLLDKAPDLYLYGSLLEAAPYMEEDNRAQLWKTYYDTAMADLASADVGARYASGRARVRGWRP